MSHLKLLRSLALATAIVAPAITAVPAVAAAGPASAISAPAADVPACTLGFGNQTFHLDCTPYSQRRRFYVLAYCNKGSSGAIVDDVDIPVGETYHKDKNVHYKCPWPGYVSRVTLHPY
ncbi:hypothetical protein GCM10010123_45610 [Pilimelia anulata]|uniref:Secreted protein n=1 Tax=Pilimelia anulata TaxID=53371 RepID=A0A8J3BBP9_9ACTN|nr:hypothetical protein [Pilimelia anulata]GGK10505.1 hypothetical protein GCM10010123_45610 [Pilimelia anulata]